MTDVSAGYESLFHYTTLKGVEGVIDSQALWCSHYEYVNDSQEIIHAKKLLVKLLSPQIAKIIEYDVMTSSKCQAVAEYLGGEEAAIDHKTIELVEQLYSSLLGTHGGSKALVQGPFIMSFCGIRKIRKGDSPSIKKDGLLSQWRGYGRDGGYAIEFDPKGLEELIKKEHDNNYYSTALPLLDVGYGLESTRLPSDFQTDLAEIKDAVSNWIDTGLKDQQALQKGFLPFIRSISRSKHEGFGEENEVRAVFFPGFAEQQQRESDPVMKRRNIKLVQFKQKQGALVPYIAVFQGFGKLPIKQIIVGPHRDKEKRKKALSMKLEGLEIRVTCSEIPFQE